MRGPFLLPTVPDVVLICLPDMSCGSVLECGRAYSCSEACSVRAGAREALFERGRSDEGMYQVACGVAAPEALIVCRR